jgi:hypothetical protein
MNNNLVAEKRPDKNGNVVTRWIRSFTNRGSSANIPAPVAVETKRVRANQTEINELCSILQPNETSPDSRLRMNLEFVADHDPELFDRIAKVSQSSEPERFYWSSMLGGSLDMCRGSRDSQEYDLQSCRTALVVNSLLRSIADGGGDVDMGSDPRMFRIWLGDIMNSSNISHPPEELTKAIALILYIRGMHKGEDYYDGFIYYEDIADDASYVVDHLDQVEAMVSELRARKDCDRETIELLMSAPSAALYEGML